MRKTANIIITYLLNSLLISSYAALSFHASELFDNLTDIITDEWLAEEILPTNYNRDKAPIKNESPVRVNVRISILELSLGTGSEMAFNVDMFMHQYWTDNRLRLPKALIAQNKTNAKIVLSPQWKNRLWTPDIHFTNAISGTIVNIISPSLYFVVTNQTNIFMAARLQMKLHCNMDFTKYPFDSQTCQIMIATLSETIESVQLNWLDFRIGKHFYLPHYEITAFSTVDCSKHNQIGVFSCLTANIYLSRNTGKYFIKRYVPSFLIVVMTFVGFWIPTSASPARVSLIVTSLLALIAQQIQPELNVSYIYALEVWTIICISFVFAALIEYAIAVAYDHAHKNTAGNTTTTQKDIKTRFKFISFASGSRFSCVDIVSRLLFPAVYALCILVYSIVYYFM